MNRQWLMIPLFFGGLFFAINYSQAQEKISKMDIATHIADTNQQGIGCEVPRLKIPKLPGPFFRSTVQYTATNPAGDQTDIYAPNIPAAWRIGWTKLPAVVILQGGSVDKSQYSEFANRLARHGYIVSVPQRIVTIGPLSGTFTNVRVLNEGFDFLKTESARRGSPIADLLDVDKLAAVGHSLGGATALFASGNVCTPPLCAPGPYARPAQLQAVVAFGANLKERPPATGFIDIDSTGVAVAHIHGAGDNVATIADARETFALEETPKAFFRVEGANHYGITNAQTSGSQPDVPQSLPQADSIFLIADTTALWLNAHVSFDGVFPSSFLSCIGGTRDGRLVIETVQN